jgi:hypothetical protein
MASIKKLGTAVVMAAVLAGGAGTASLEAAAKAKKTTSTMSAQTATCQYLTSVMTYSYVNPSIMLTSATLYNSYSCGQ